jgi:threonine/homoserine/homoserine lactone efflux protein
VSKKHTFTWYNGLSVIIFVGMFYTFIFNRNPINIIVFQLLFGVIVVVSVLGQAWSAAKRNRLRRQMQQRYH